MDFFKHNSTSGVNSQCFGFTLIEVIISVAIIGIMSALFVTNRSNFSRTVNLSNIAHDVSIVLQQAQSYGTSNRGSGIGEDTSGFAYGVHFDTSEDATFQLFRDADGNNQFDDNDTEPVEEYELPDTMRLSDLCVTNGDVVSAGCPNSGDDRSQLTVLFRRPDPDALFYSSGSPESAAKAMIAIEPRGSADSRRVIVVGETGFVTVKTP